MVAPGTAPGDPRDLGGEQGPGALLSILNVDTGKRRPLWREHRNFQSSGTLVWAARNLLVYGGSLAWQDTELIAVAPDGGRRKRLTKNDISEFQPAVSPDGERIAFVREGRYEDREIWSMRRDGSGARRLVAESEVRFFGTAWSPGGDEIAFVRVHTRAGNEEGSPPDVFVMKRDDLVVRRLTRNAWAPDPAWSPDGRLAYTRMNRHPDCRAIWVTAPGGDAEQLTDCDFYAAAPAWSPDGKTVAFLGRPAAEVGLNIPLHLYVVESGGGDPRLVARDVQKQRGVGRPNDEPSFEAPSWSPDGQRLVYSRNGGPAGLDDLGLHVVEVDGGRPVRIVRAGHDPFWASP